LNENGRSYAFDSRGDGYGRGEGCTVLVLKRVADAVKDGDHIRAIIRGTNVNHNGRTSGITMPDPAAQEALIKSTYEKAGMRFNDCNYVEAHGTGTVVGDLAEISALANLAASSSSQERNLFIGSVKANIGHLENVSGLAGVLKAVLVLERGIIPPIADLHKIKDVIQQKLGTLQVSQSIALKTFTLLIDNSYQRERGSGLIHQHGSHQ
jgi:acyl transferase domain-containing protein